MLKHSIFNNAKVVRAGVLLLLSLIGVAVMFAAQPSSALADGSHNVTDRYYLECPYTSVREGFPFWVTLVRATHNRHRHILKVSWHTDAGTADSSDYTNWNGGTVEYPSYDAVDGRVTQRFQVTRDNDLDEEDETFTVRFSTPDVLTDNVHDHRFVAPAHVANPNNPARDGKCEITIINEGEHTKPGFPKHSYTHGVSENLEPGTDVGGITALNLDDDETLTYSLSGTDADELLELLDLDASTGRFTIKSGVHIDYEGMSKTTFEVTLSVSDGEDASGEAEAEPTVDDSTPLTVVITNANDPGVVTLSTDSPQVGVPITATLTDPDYVMGGRPFRSSWSHSKTADGPFSVYREDYIRFNRQTTYTPQEKEQYKYLLFSAVYYDSLCVQAHLYSGKCRRQVSVVAANPVADADGQIIQESQENSPATGRVEYKRWSFGSFEASLKNFRDENGTENRRNGLVPTTFKWYRVDPFTGEETEVPHEPGLSSNYYRIRTSEMGYGIRARVTTKDDLNNVETIVGDVIDMPPPANRAATGKPTISGTAQVGLTLNADTSEISDPNGLHPVETLFSYQWIRTAGSEDIEIEGATGQTYTLVSADAGNTVKVKVSFEDRFGYDESRTSDSTSTVAGNNVATGKPTISGTARVGQTLTAGTSAIADADGLTGVSYSYNWLADGAYISGATSSSYTLTVDEVGDAISVLVWFTDDEGNSEAIVSATTSDVLSLQSTAATGAPTISGTHGVGETLTASTSGISDTDGLTNATFSYQWIRQDLDTLTDTRISGATSSTYTVTAADEGKGIKVRVSFTDDAGNAETLNSAVLSPTVSQPTPGNNSPATGAPSISGTHSVGETLTADTSGISDTDGLTNATFSYQWIRHDLSSLANETITGATSSTYTVTAADDGKGISVRVSFTDDAGNAESLNSYTLAPPPPPLTTRDPNNEATGSPVISGNLVVGETLTASTTGISDEDGLTNATFSYQWLRVADDATETDISGATKSKYTITDGDEGKGIKVRVSFSDDAGNAESLTSADPSESVAAQNSPATGAPGISGSLVVGETLTASTTGIADEDGLTSATYGYQWIRRDLTALTDEDISGATSSTYTLTDSEAGKGIKVRVSFSDDAGNAESLTGEPTSAVKHRLTATARNVPERHDGSGNIKFDLVFDHQLSPDLSYLTLREHAFTVTGGTLLRTRRISPPGNVEWRITVRPSGSADVVITLPATTNCDDQGAVCMEDGRKLSSSLEITVPRNSLPTGLPTVGGTVRVGETLTASTTGISDADGLTTATYGYQWIRRDLTALTDTDIAGATGSTYTLADDDEGKGIRVRVSFSDDRGNAHSLTGAATRAVGARGNAPATGSPVVSGTPVVGETLTALTSGIADTDGMTGASFGYRWIRRDPTTLAEEAISGATGSTYTLTDSEVGKGVKVSVSFSDDAGNAESLTSEPTSPVKHNLTATARNVPAGHDGSSNIKFDLVFDHRMEPDLSYLTLRDHAFTVTGGTVRRAKRIAPPGNVEWRITVRPSGSDDVVITLPATTNCAGQGAVCMDDGRKLSNSVVVTVPLTETVSESNEVQPSDAD